MADKNIGALPQADDLYDDSLFVVEHGGTAKKVTGGQFKDYAKEGVEIYVDAAQKAAQDALSAVKEVGTAVADTQANKMAAQAAQTAAETAEQGAEDARAAIEGMLVEAVSLATGEPATVTKALVDDVVKLVFGLPAGAKGDRGNTGSSIQSITRTGGTGAAGTVDTYTITMTDGATSTFQVYNGADGIGAGDMLAAIYDPQKKGQDVFAYADTAAATAVSGKQDKLTGTVGQVVGFDVDGNPVAQEAPEGGVISFNGRGGAVVPQEGDYTAKQVGADPAGSASGVQSAVNVHINNKGNPHGVTMVQLGAAPTASPVFTRSISLGRRVGTTVSTNSFAAGSNVTASGYASHAEGGNTIASGDYSHAEGADTIASGYASHAENSATIAASINAHAEGSQTIAAGTDVVLKVSSYNASSKTFVFDSTFIGFSTAFSKLAVGVKLCVINNAYYDSRDIYTILSINQSAKSVTVEENFPSSYSVGFAVVMVASTIRTAHAEGWKSIAIGSPSHAEGYSTTASGHCSHAEGTYTTASGADSHASGYGTVAKESYQFVIGRHNKDGPGGYGTGGFIMGKGSSDSVRANAFRIADDGVYGGPYNSSGADYAELFEWADGNPAATDRAGLFVTLGGEHISLATPEDDYILGIVSASPSVVGDVYDDQWAGIYLRDVFGRTIYEEQSFPEETSPDGTVILEARRELAPKLNPDYDPASPYLPRTQRPEWSAVGMMGKLVAVDDGTCQVNGYCTVGLGGVATHTDGRTPYRVMARLDETHIRVLIL